jgi:uncharacterized protein YndB with AHSA1/START domain
MSVAPEAVWDVLADPFQYAHWVVGSKEIRAADPGSRRRGRGSITPSGLAR